MGTAYAGALPVPGRALPRCEFGKFRLRLRDFAIRRCWEERPWFLSRAAVMDSERRSANSSPHGRSNLGRASRGSLSPPLLRDDHQRRTRSSPRFERPARSHALPGQHRQCHRGDAGDGDCRKERRVGSSDSEARRLEPAEVEVGKSFNGWVFGNILFVGVIGVVIDALSGSIMAYDEDSIHVELIPLAEGGS